ncbi:hypothetical protein AB6N22_12755, partial [Kocuria palustris]|uniref:hypothetical protein n=1 Tax=Kocuria palustris TaxID=71999 RepID=UPI0039A12242
DESRANSIDQDKINHLLNNQQKQSNVKVEYKNEYTEHKQDQSKKYESLYGGEWWLYTHILLSF